MEKNTSLSNNLKDYGLGEETKSSNIYAEDYISGFSWPPRSYVCSFCKREFRSAQALGGHMNVHRRDRARLRQSPPSRNDGQYPFLNLNLNSNPNPNPNPNPNFPPSSPPSPPHSTRLPPPYTTCTLPSLVSPSLSSSSSASPSQIKKWGTVDGTLLYPSSSRGGSDFAKMKARKCFFGVKEFDDNCKLMKKAEIVRLELGLGLLSDSKEDVDLELRLGYS